MRKKTRQWKLVMRLEAHILLTLALSLTTACSAPDVPGGHGDSALDTSDDSSNESSGESGESSNETEDDSDGPETSGDDSDTAVVIVPDGLCVIDEFTAPEVRPKVMLVLDQSSSMVSNTLESYGPEGYDPEFSKWAELHGQVWELVSRIDGYSQLGLQLYPESAVNPEDPDWQCAVSNSPTVALGFQHSEKLMAALPDPDASEFNGASPAAAAIVAAADHLQAVAAHEPGVIVLVTDGAANCSEQANDPLAAFDHDLVDLIDGLHDEEGIPTFVVGVAPQVEAQSLPKVTTYSALSELAVAGGVTKSQHEGFYGPGDMLALERGIQAIAENHACTFESPAPGEDLTLNLDGFTVPEVEYCATDQGWRTIHEGSEIVLCGGTCDAFVDGAKVSVATACE